MTKNQKQLKEPPVNCAYDEMISIEKVKANMANPNTHPPEQVEKLARLIRAHGWRNPITVSNRSGFVVQGHCRLLAAQKLGLKLVPVDYQDFGSDAEEWACMVADNIVAELAEMDNLKMEELLGELDQTDYNLDLTGLDAQRIQEFLNDPGVNQSAEEITEELRPFNKTHVLISFPPDKFTKIEPMIEELRKDSEFEIEQASN